MSGCTIKYTFDCIYRYYKGINISLNMWCISLPVGADIIIQCAAVLLGITCMISAGPPREDWIVMKMIILILTRVYTPIQTKKHNLNNSSTHKVNRRALHLFEIISNNFDDRYESLKFVHI